MTFVPAPGYQPTYNPILPYSSPIPGGLSVGMSIYIQGETNEHMRRFAVNFAMGPEPEADIAFHFNPRFDGWDKVVFNSRQSGQWNEEERKKSMPFKKGEPFELVVMIMQEYYKVMVNGNPFYEFGHRIPIQAVTHLQVDGDLTVRSINFIGGNPTPNQGPGVAPQPPVNLPSMEGAPVFNPPVPYTGKLQGGLMTRRTIIIKGFVPSSAKRFAINFKVGLTGEVALHINPRLDEGVVVRNSLQNGAWGSEERNVSHNPFSRGEFFDLSIRAGTDRFKVFANGRHLFDFSHRLSAFQTVDILEITGDVNLSYVQI
ncbi:galectin-4 isoform X2 [Sorex fumeus]|uniref:galectin-4 isoform X2 n=1 Tax=Sorex fumeus TaxID=62283 RepID=UPI0024AE0ED6|nr:galectin-4 isoform X2 [Sorex fumeus]